ncbi:MAG: glycosyltransferase family 4 protein [Fibrobacteres bacterium]|nr:glycosyltransferase family 4 protein [Fibrobacterota bacterium]
MKRHKILVVNWRDINNPEAGGAEVHYHEIFKRLNRDSFDVTVLASTFEGCERESVIDGIPVSRRGSRLLFNYWIYANIHRFIKGRNFDLIVDDVNKIPFFLSRLTRKPVVSIFHHLFSSSIFHECSFIPAMYVWLSEKLIGPGYKNSHFSAVSKSTFDELVGKGLKPELGTIIHNGIDLQRYTPKRDEMVPNHLLFVGRIKKYKNTAFLIPLFAELKKRIPELTMTIAGGGDYLPQLRQMAEAHSGITVTGFVSEEEKIRLYRSAALFVNPSIKEGWSITNIESCACGTPVLASDSPGLRDSVKSGLNGELFPYNDLTSCVSKAEELLKNSKKLSELSFCARTFAEQYSWDRSAAETTEFLNRFLK